MKFNIEKFQAVYKNNQPWAIKMIKEYDKKNIDRMFKLKNKFKHINIQNINENIEVIDSNEKEIKKIQKSLREDLKTLEKLKEITRANIFIREIDHLKKVIIELNSFFDQHFLLADMFKKSQD